MTAVSARQHRTIIVLLCIAIALCISFALSSIPRQLGMSAAHAQAVGSGSAVAPALPDPTTSPVETYSLLSGLYHAGAFVSLAVIVGFYITRFTGAHVKRPNVAHWFALASGVLALFVPPILDGQTPNLKMLVGFAVPIIALFAPGLIPTAGRQAQAGFARLRVMLLVAIAGIGAVLLLGACGGPTPVPVADIIDCIKLEGGADWQAVEQALKPDVDAHDWGKLVTDAEALGPKVGLDIAGCVAVELVQQYLSVKRADGSSWAAHDAVEKLRSKLSGSNGKSVTFHTGVGNL